MIVHQVKCDICENIIALKENDKNGLQGKPIAGYSFVMDKQTGYRFLPGIFEESDKHFCFPCALSLANHVERQRPALPAMPVRTTAKEKPA